MREIFDRELRHLHDEVLRMGSEVADNLPRVVAAFISGDMVVSQLIIDADRSINERRIQIGMDSLRLIATQQPVAGDMRLVGAVMEIVGELERIHDYIKGIGRIRLNLGSEPVLPTLAVSMPEMADISRDMLNKALTAFAVRDADQALLVPGMDTRVDDLFYEAYSDIVAYAMSEPDQIHLANHLEWACHNLERSADRAINICEWVVYMVTGDYTELDTGEYEAPPENVG